MSHAEIVIQDFIDGSSHVTFVHKNRQINIICFEAERLEKHNPLPSYPLEKHDIAELINFFTWVLSSINGEAKNERV